MRRLAVWGATLVLGSVVGGCGRSQLEQESSELVTSSYFLAKDLTHQGCGEVVDDPGWGTGPSWSQDCNGSTDLTFDFGPTGTFSSVVVSARGVYGQGDWPQVQLMLDGAPISRPLTVSSPTPQYYRFRNLGQGVPSFYTTPGTHVLQVAFINDAYGGPGDDRNFVIHDLSFTSAPGGFPAYLWSDRFVERNGCYTFSPLGGYVQLCNGSAEGYVQFPATGQYLLKALLSGEPGGGEAPQAQILVDGQPVSPVFTVPAPESGNYDEVSGTFSAQVQVEEGVHRVGVSFLNDFYGGPGDDRNLHVGQVNVTLP